MKKKLMLVLAVSVSFMPAAFADDSASQLGQINKISSLPPAALACGRKYVDKASQGSQSVNVDRTRSDSRSGR